MKPISAACFALAAWTILGCDPELQQALDDVSSTAPSICGTYCEKAISCAWKGFTSKGGEKENTIADDKDLCILMCAYQAENGTYVYEYDYNEGEPIYDFGRAVSGDDWQAYMECLEAQGLWSCDTDHYALEIFADTQAKCDAWENCAKNTKVVLSFDWSATDERCYPTSDEDLW